MSAADIARTLQTFDAAERKVEPAFVADMPCGPVRHRVSAKLQAAARPFSHSVIVRPTAFVSSREPDTDKRVQF